MIKGMVRRAFDVLVDGHLNQRYYDFYGDDTYENSYIANAGTAQSATNNTITLASGASSTDDAYNGYGIVIIGGTGSGQDHLRITDYNGTTKVATLTSTWTTNPDSTSTYRIIKRGY